MPGSYVELAFQRFQHIVPSRPIYSPHARQKPTYSAKTQYTPPENTSTSLNAADFKPVQEVLGTFPFYARSVDSTTQCTLPLALLPPNKKKAPKQP